MLVRIIKYNLTPWRGAKALERAPEGEVKGGGEKYYNFKFAKMSTANQTHTYHLFSLSPYLSLKYLHQDFTQKNDGIINICFIYLLEKITTQTILHLSYPFQNTIRLSKLTQIISTLIY